MTRQADMSETGPEELGHYLEWLFPIRGCVRQRRDVPWERCIVTALLSLVLLTVALTGLHLAHASADASDPRFRALGPGASWPLRAAVHARQEWPAFLAAALFPDLALLLLFMSFPFGYAEGFIYRWTAGRLPRGRREVVLAFKYTLLGCQTWVFAVPVALGLQVVLTASGRYFMGAGGAQVAGVLVLLTVLCLTVWVLSRQVARAVLVAMDDRYCHTCGYPLEGLLAARCPECGTPFDPRRVAAESARQDKS